MMDLILTKPRCEIQYFVFIPEDDNSIPRPLQVSARDFGYEIDEQEVAEELIAPLPISFQIPKTPDVDADDFEKIYQWFLA